MPNSIGGGRVRLNKNKCADIENENRDAMKLWLRVSKYEEKKNEMK